MWIKLLIIALLTLGACGKKTDLIVYNDSAPEPVLQNVNFSSDVKVFHLKLNIQGGSGAVLYEVDRAEVDSSCQCITQWFRYYKSSPSLKRNDLQHHFKLQRADVIYAFRVRAMDSLGRKTTWSKTMKTNTNGMNEKL